MTDRVAILGNGVAGSTLYYLLRKTRPELSVHLYGKQHPTSCGIRPCAWGVNTGKFISICSQIELDPNKYILNQSTCFRINGKKMPCDISMIDKPLLLKNLNNNTLYDTPDLTRYNRVIDATGVSTNGTIRHCYQQLVKGEFPLSSWVNLFPNPTCIWVFLLSGVSHIGIFSLNGMPKEIKLGTETICECRSTLSTGLLDKLVTGNVWKVGEAAGIIDPITGSGILPAMLSAQLLNTYWDDAREYENAIRYHFGYMKHPLRALFHNEFRGIPIKPVGLLYGMFGFLNDYIKSTETVLESLYLKSKSLYPIVRFWLYDYPRILGLIRKQD